MVNYKRKTVPRICQWCGVEFMARTDTPGKFCTKSHSAKSRRGERNPMWKGGMILTDDCRWVVLRPEHPRAFKNGYVFRAILVLEEKLGRMLADNEVAHHKNQKQWDDAPDNLEVMERDEHSRYHRSITTRDRDELGRFS